MNTIIAMRKKSKFIAWIMVLILSIGVLPSYVVQAESNNEYYQTNIMESVDVNFVNYSNVTSTGTVGMGGANWRLYDDGTVIVGGGVVGTLPFASSPWLAYRDHISKIIFTESISSGFSLSNLFRDLYNLTTIENLHHLDTTGVMVMGEMFRGTNSLTSLDLSNFNTSSVMIMGEMFMGASSLTSLDLSSFNTSGVASLGGMFMGASSLTSLNLSTFNTSNVMIMSEMFSGASSLTNLDLSNFDTRNTIFKSDMLNGMNSLNQLTLGENTIFNQNPNLPQVPSNITYTGRWRNIGTGTVSSPIGDFALTSNELTSQFNGGEMADTWVWQPYIQDSEIRVTGIAIYPIYSTVEIGQNINLTAIITPENATNQNVTWVSLNPQIATVDENGVVTAIREGQARIVVATLDGGHMTTATVTVTIETPTPPASNQIRVLTINPHNNASHTFARWFEGWVNGAGGSNQNLERNRNLNPLNQYGEPTIIFEQVTTYQLTRPVNNRNFVDIETLLRDEDGNYRFNVIAVGSWDYGGILRPGNEAHIIQAVSDFMDAGGGVLFGHDTLLDRHRTSHGRGDIARTTFSTAAGTLLDGYFYRNPLNRLYGMNYLFAPLAHRAGVIPSQRVDRFAHYSNTAARRFAVITEEGSLTSYPFQFEVGQIIPISNTHNNGALTTGTVWAQFVERHNTGTMIDITGNINGSFRLNPHRNMSGGNTIIDFSGRYITPQEWGNRHRNQPYAQNAHQPAGIYQSNAFISTFENTAHIQYWRQVQYLTLEERKLFVNTLFYLANFSE